MTYRDDDEVIAARLTEAERALAAATEERDRLERELAELAERTTDLGVEIATKRGSTLSARAWLRVAGLMVAVFAAGATSELILEVDARTGYAFLGCLSAGLCALLWRGYQQSKAMDKIIEAHDAGMKAVRVLEAPVDVAAPEDVAEPAPSRERAR